MPGGTHAVKWPRRPILANPNGLTRSIRCLSSTPQARPESPRACSIRPPAICCGRCLTMKWVFDNKPTDIFWCTADVGWVTGTHLHRTYGPLAVRYHGEVVFEGMPTYPDAGPLLENDRRTTRSTSFYTAPTAIRSLIKAGDADEKIHAEEIRSLQPAHPRHGRRADQSGSLDVVPHATSATNAARSSIPGGRPRPAAT